MATNSSLQTKITQPDKIDALAEQLEEHTEELLEIVSNCPRECEDAEFDVDRYLLAVFYSQKIAKTLCELRSYQDPQYQSFQD